MVSKLLVLSVAVLVLGVTGQGSAHWQSNGQGRYYYPQQRYPGYNQPRYQQPQQPQYQLPPGVSLNNAEWVCNNPKTGDMMIIAQDDSPATNKPGGNRPGQWQQPNYPQTQPPVNRPTYPQQPTYPPTGPNYPTTDGTNPGNWPTYPTQPPQQPQTQEPPNTDGDGVIDIRFGQRK